MNTRKLTVRHWRLAFLFWFIWMTCATHFPQDPPTDAEPFFESPDKLLHFLCFGILAFLFIQTRWVKSLVACLILLGLWAVFDEVTQHLLPIQREFSYADLFASELGIVSFAVWTGALSGESTSHIREAVNTILSKATNWISIFFIGSLVTTITTVLIWYFLREIHGKQYSSIALFDAFIIATSCVLWFFIRKGGLQKDASRLIKSMFPTILLTMVFAAMAGILVLFTTFEPLVVAMMVLLVGSRIAWNRAT
jgi:VanZ family protein